MSNYARFLEDMDNHGIRGMEENERYLLKDGNQEMRDLGKLMFAPLRSTSALTDHDVKEALGLKEKTKFTKNNGNHDNCHHLMREVRLDNPEALFNAEMVNSLVSLWAKVERNGFDYGSLDIRFSHSWDIAGIHALNQRKIYKLEGMDYKVPALDSIILRYYKARMLFLDATLLAGCGTSKNHDYQSRYFTKVNEHGTYRVRIGEMTLYIKKRHCAISFDNLHYTLWNHGYLLSVSDNLTDRFNALMCCHIHCQDNPEKYPSPELLHSIYRSVDEMFEKIGYLAYKFVKKIEPLMLTYMVANFPSDLAKYPSFNRTITEEVKDLVVMEGIVPEYRKFQVLLYALPLNFYSEFHGIFRHWSHPIVDGLKGMAAIRGLGNKHVYVEESMREDIKAQAIKKIFTSYRRKNGLWPRHNCNLVPHGPLKNALSKNRDLNEHDPAYNHKDWCKVKVAKIFPLPCGYDMGLLMDDKTLSLEHIPLIEAIMETKNLSKNPNKKLLTYVLKHEAPPSEEFIEKINREGFDQKSMYISLVEKERENKTTPRMFAATTPEFRRYIVESEAMVAKHILPLYEEITMTFSEMELRDRKTKLLKMAESPDTNLTFLMLDLEKWCTSQRKDALEPVFEVFDQLFGLKNFFNRSHEMFSDSRKYLGSGDYNLMDDSGEWIDETSFIEFQGGLEGLKQKPWTAASVNLIAMAAEGLDLNYFVMSQGDNIDLVVVHKIIEKDSDGTPSELEAKRMRDSVLAFKESIKQTFKRVGMTLKVEETLVSENPIIYGKDIIANGRQLTNSVKKASRFSYFPNETRPAESNGISSLGTTGLATASSNIVVIPAFFQYSWNLMEAFKSYHHFSPTLGKGLGKIQVEKVVNFYDGGLTYSQGILPRVINQLAELSDNILLIKALIPVAIGGLPVMTIQNFITKVAVDPLTDALFVCRESLGSNILPEETREYILRFLNIPLKTTIDPTEILEDPYSFNMFKPSTIQNAIKLLVKSSLPGRTDNRPLKELFSHASMKEPEVADFLWNTTPFKPAILKEIYSSTPIAEANECAGRFSSSKTITTGLSVNHEIVNQKLQRSEEKSILYLAFRMSRQSPESIYKCSVEWATHLRETGLQRTDLVGITYPVPLELLKRYELRGGHCHGCDINDDFVIAQTLYSANKTIMTRHQGPKVAYLGSLTQNKNTSKNRDLKINNVSSHQARKLNIQELRGWFTPVESGLSKFIEKLVTNVSEIDPSLLHNPEYMSTGTPDHRFKTTSGVNGCTVNLASTGLSYILLDMNKSKSCTKGGNNNNLLYQSIMLYMSVREVHGAYYQPYHFPSTHYHFDCYNCIQEIPDNLVESKEIFPDTSQLKDNPYLRINPNSLSMSLSPLIKLPQTSHRVQHGELILLAHITAGADTYYRTLKYRMIEGAIFDASRSGGSYAIFLNTDPILLLVGPVLTILGKAITESIGLDTIVDIQEHIYKKTYRAIHDQRENLQVAFGKIYAKTELLDHLMSWSGGFHQIAEMPYRPSDIGKSLVNYVQNIFTYLWQSEKKQVINNNPHLDDLLELIKKGYVARESLQIPSLKEWKKEIYLITGIKYLMSKVMNKDKREEVVRILNSYRNIEELTPNIDLIEIPGHLGNRKYPVEMRDIRDFFQNIYILKLPRLYEAMFKDHPLDKSLASPWEVTGIEPKDFSELGKNAHEIDMFHSRQLIPGVIVLDEYRPPNNFYGMSLYCKVKLALTSTPYKFAGLYAKLYKDLVGRPKVVIGDGTGGCLETLYRLDKQPVSFYNSLVDVSDCLENSLDNIFPAALLKAAIPCPDGLSLMRSGISDVSEGTWFDQAKEILDSTKFHGAFINCDAEYALESQGKNVEGIALTIYKIAKHIPDSRALVKQYHSSKNYFHGVLALYLQYFETVSVYRSDFSTNGSTEIFFFCKNPHPNPLSQQVLPIPDLDRCMEKFSEPYMDTLYYERLCKRIDTILQSIRGDGIRLSSLQSLLNKLGIHQDLKERIKTPRVIRGFNRYMACDRITKWNPDIRMRVNDMRKHMTTEVIGSFINNFLIILLLPLDLNKVADWIHSHYYKIELFYYRAATGNVMCLLPYIKNNGIRDAIARSEDTFLSVGYTVSRTHRKRELWSYLGLLRRYQSYGKLNLPRLKSLLKPPKEDFSERIFSHILNQWNSHRAFTDLCFQVRNTRV